MVFELVSSSLSSRVLPGRAVYSASDGHYGIAVHLSDVVTSDGDDGGPTLSVAGSITSHGLSPETFAVRNDLAGDLLFPRQRGGGGKLNTAGLRTGRLRDGLLDRQSLLFHFSLQPPNPGGGQILLSDGKGYVAYSYRVEQGGREPFPALGDVAVSRVTLQAQTGGARGGEMIELYLIPELGYLPVRMRFTNEVGEVIEQRVTGLNYR